MIRQLKIPPKYWDCSRSDYVALPFVTQTDCPDDCITPEGWAFVAGLWDGLAEDVAGIPQLLALLSTAQGRQQLKEGLTALKSKETWQALWDKTKAAHPAHSPCQLNHQIGYDVLLF